VLSVVIRAEDEQVVGVNEIIFFKRNRRGAESIANQSILKEFA